MVSLTKIYTRGGDKGETSLGDGSRVKKFDARVVAYGTVDEANAAIGIARIYTSGEPDNLLALIQNDLFDLGADLCRPENGAPSKKVLRINRSQVERLEKEIDLMNETLKPLSSFILPGGSKAGSYLHLARTIVRRAERKIVELSERDDVNKHAIQYINRLSDHLFQLARKVNREGSDDNLWIPGNNR